VGQGIDAAFILAVLLVNAAIGSLQEWQAQRKALELDSLVPRRSVVLRSGAWVELDSVEIVPGDMVRLESGLQVGADLRLADSRELVIDESLLTGESTPVGKDASAELAEETGLAGRKNMLFAGTSVLAGRAAALVVATGAATEIGRIAQVLTPAEAQPLPLIRQLDRFSRLLGLATVVLIGLVAVAPLVVGWARMYQGMHFLTDVIGGIVLGAVSVATARWILGRPADTVRHQAVGHHDERPVEPVESVETVA